MELEATHLYGDKSQVMFNVQLDINQQKPLIKQVRTYFLALAIDEVECSLERVAGRGLLSLWPVNALVVYAPLGDCAFQSVITLNVFTRHLVLSLYKSFISDTEFVINHSAEIRRRVIVTRLGCVQLADRFSLLDQAVEHTWSHTWQILQALNTEKQEETFA